MFGLQRLASAASGLLAAFAVGCLGVQRGTPVDIASVPRSQVVVGSALTTEAGGLRVLWNGPVRGSNFDQRAFIAGNQAQLGALWVEVGEPAPQPVVNFSEYVVLATAGQGAECPVEVLAVDLEPDSVLRVRTASDFSCSDVAVRRALVLAVPRRLLGPSVTFVER